MIYSGLDWSADVNGPTLVLAIVFVGDTDQALLEQELAAARTRLGRDPDYVFKHTEAIANTHVQFYAAIRKVPSLQAFAFICDQSRWALQHVKTRLGDPCVCDGIVTLALGCPTHLIADQIMYIDMPREELPVIDAYRTALRKSLRQAKRRSFRRISPRPDDRLNSGIVQVADMIAGEVRENSGLFGSYLPTLGFRIYLV